MQMTPPSGKLTPFQEKLIKLRLAGMSLFQIAEHTGRKYGTIRNDFGLIYRTLDIKLGCELSSAYLRYEMSTGQYASTVKEIKNKINEE
jgi:DNA-binding NarL/FixJ family response regulator